MKHLKPRWVSANDPRLRDSGTYDNGVTLPPVVPSSQIDTTASGLAYSRLSQTFNGTVTVKNISSSAVSGPLQIVFFGTPVGVTLTNATANLSSTPYMTVPAIASLGSWASAAPITYDVTVKTSSISGTAGSLDFNFNPGLWATQSVSLQILGFASDGTLVNCGSNVQGFCPTGAVGVTLPSTLTFDNGTGFNLPSACSPMLPERSRR
jgi:hypothetical protein